ncbi:MAG: hypothetical protein E7B73_07365 [Bifidobacterium longum]|nr:hypothetical protein [Bifidobacterium longum]
MRESAHEFHCTHAGRSTTIYYRHTADELDLPDELWELVRVKANLLTPSKKPIARDSEPGQARPPHPRLCFSKLASAL